MEILEISGWMAEVRLTARDAATLARACRALEERLVTRDEALEAAYVEALGAALGSTAKLAVAKHAEGVGPDYERECQRIGLR